MGLSGIWFINKYVFVFCVWYIYKQLFNINVKTQTSAYIYKQFNRWRVILLQPVATFINMD